MSQIKPGFYCAQEQKYVAAVRQTHYVRNALLVLLVPATFGLSLLIIQRSTPWFCPDCGGPVNDIEADRLAQARTELWSAIPTWVKWAAIPAFLLLVGIVGNL
jgi:hypothetical protein